MTLLISISKLMEKLILFQIASSFCVSKTVTKYMTKSAETKFRVSQTKSRQGYVLIDTIWRCEFMHKSPLIWVHYVLYKQLLKYCTGYCNIYNLKLQSYFFSKFQNYLLLFLGRNVDFDKISKFCSNMIILLESEC